MGILIICIILLLVAGLCAGIAWILAFFMPVDQAQEIGTCIGFVIVFGGGAVIAWMMDN